MSHPSRRLPQEERDSWRAVLAFNLYRLNLATLLTALFAFGVGPSLLGQYDPRLYLWTGVVYLGSTLVSLAINRLRWPPMAVQVYLQVAVDVVFITSAMHASGGLASGLGMLLIPSVAAGGLLMRGRMSLMYASMAALFILGEQVFAHWSGAFETTYYTQAGILGAAFLATALLAHGLANRARESEALAEQRGVDLANLEELNEYIIRHFQSGIVVVDRELHVRLMNDSAQRLLLPDGRRPQECVLNQISDELLERLQRWRGNPLNRPLPFRSPNGEFELLPRFAAIGERGEAGCLIFLEESGAIAERARQVKLAALGRLTASIAHEVRNPLGAIAHAAQLLAESPLDQQDARLLEIILKQSGRVNGIIENVMQLSRRDRNQPEMVELGPWSDALLGEFAASHAVAEATVEVDVPAGITVFVDPSQLHQVLWNLCENALRHGDPGAPGPVLRIVGGAGEHGPWLEVGDNGPGIDTATAERIFEPFFTTRAEGSGLGLYIARELCEANRAHLGYRPHEGGGSVFRISFATTNGTGEPR